MFKVGLNGILDLASMRLEGNKENQAGTSHCTIWEEEAGSAYTLAGQWRDVVLMDKVIGQGSDTAPE